MDEPTGIVLTTLPSFRPTPELLAASAVEAQTASVTRAPMADSARRTRGITSLLFPEWIPATISAGLAVRHGHAGVDGVAVERVLLRVRRDTPQLPQENIR